MGTQMRSVRIIITLFLLSLVWINGCGRKSVGPGPGETWVAFHLLNYTEDSILEELGKKLPQLAGMGVNVMILEVGYRFDYQSHPELRQGDTYISKNGARAFAKHCKENDIRLIPLFQCLGHQSWAKKTFPLLTQYPHFDLTPGAFPGNEGIYCREWDPTNPEINKIVFALMDELIDAFEADAIHVGMDEVFLLGSEQSPSTRGKNPAELYAKTVNEIYDHLVKKRGVEMLMWGDRLIDDRKYSYGEWEADRTGIHAAVDLIPRDIIICDWHYEARDDYPSIPMFLEKGFRVLPTSWMRVEAVKKLIGYSLQQTNPNMLGHLFTTWGEETTIVDYEPLLEGLKLLR